MVSVGAAGRGGTGSFISGDGLIITNHHVALDAVRQVSTEEHDYLKEGFVARDRSQEVKGPEDRGARYIAAEAPPTSNM